MKPITQTHPAVKRRTLLAAAAVLVAGLSLASTAAAIPANLVDLQVVDRSTGQALPFWRQNGRQFVAGDPGARYALRATNRTGERMLLVLSVDGVNVLTGDTARFDQRGYVVDAYETYDVTGWRKSQTEVAAFTFAPLRESYASRTGRPGDVGVVGMAVFRERAPQRPQPYAEASRDRAEPRYSDRLRGLDGAPPLPPPSVPAPVARSKAAPAPSQAPAPPPMAAPSVAGAAAETSIARRTDEKLGTAHGAREWSSITTVDFVRATPYPQSVRQIEYDTAPHLIARGVTPPYAYGEETSRPPRPFPQEPSRQGFAPDPPGDR